MQGQDPGWAAALWLMAVWLLKGFRSPRAELHAPTCQQVVQHHTHKDCLVGRTAAKPVSCAEGSAAVSSSLNHAATCTGSGPDQDISKGPQQGGCFQLVPHGPTMQESRAGLWQWEQLCFTFLFSPNKQMFSLSSI